MARDTGPARAATLSARIASLIVGAAFLLLLVSAATNEDPPTSAGVIVLAILVLELAACAATWRWQRAGGIAVVAGATALAASVWLAAPASPGNALAMAGMAIYGLPFILVGFLFVMAGRE
jgi:hypothetical protein